MLDEFNALRTRARINRDRALAAVRREYEVALEKIAALQQELLGQQSTRKGRVGAAIESVIPLDTDFTVNDVVTALEDKEPERPWHYRSVYDHLIRLREQGLLRLVRRARSNEPAVFVRVETPLKGRQLDDVPLLAAIGKVFVRPMTLTEIMVAMIESGYQTKMSKVNLRHTVRKLLGRNGYKQDGGKWVP